MTDLISLSLPWIRGMCVSRSIGAVKLYFVFKLKQIKQRKNQKKEENCVRSSNWNKGWFAG